MDTAVMLCGHGSRDPEAVARIRAGRRRHQAPAPAATAISRPVISNSPGRRSATGSTRCRRAARARILAVPGMLFAASHVKNDLPWEMNSFAADNPGIEVRFGRDLAIDAEAARAPPPTASPSRARRHRAARGETLLVVVGRGTNDPDANSNIAKVARMLWEGHGLRLGRDGVQRRRPSARRRRRSTARRGSASAASSSSRISCSPASWSSASMRRPTRSPPRFPEIEFVKAPYLRDHPLVLDAFADRVDEIVDGEPAMNCQLCKYRTQIIGYESDAGAPQAGHHHHVRGIGTSAAHPSRHGHDHHHRTIRHHHAVSG